MSNMSRSFQSIGLRLAFDLHIRCRYCIYIFVVGIAHRDLKPSNIVCVYPGHLTPLKLIDFDLASEYIYDSNNPRNCVSTPRLRSPVSAYYIYIFIVQRCFDIILLFLYFQYIS